MEWLLLGIALLLIAGTGLFVAAEFSLLTVDKHAVEESVARGERGAGTLQASMRHLSTQLSAAQVGITLTTLLTGYLMEPSLARLLAGPMESIGVPVGAAEPISLAIALLVATTLSMVFGELVPKNLAIAVPLTLGRWVTPFQYGFSVVFKPIIAVLNGTANKALRAMGIEPQEEGSAGRSPQELTALVRHSAESGTLDGQTATLLTRTLEFSEHTAADVMTPRTRMVAVARDATAAEIIELTRRTGYSRFPVIGDSRDDIVGAVHVKQAVAVPLSNRRQAYSAGLMTDVGRVPETVTLEPLLGSLRTRGLQMIVVLDEFGGTAGVVTLEDVVEEIVGEVADEHDRMRVAIRRGRDGTWVIPGQLRPDEINEVMPADIPESPDYDTVAGFVMRELGRVPAVGDQVRIDTGLLTVERMQRRRVERIRFTPDWAAAGAARAERRTDRGETR